MIATVASAGSFGDAVDYLRRGKPKVDPSERVDWIVTRNLPGDDAEANAVVMQATAEQNARVAEPVYHLKIAWHPEDHPTRAEMEQVADRVLQDLGLQDHQVLIVAHKDRPHRHVHLVVNRIHPATLKPWDRYQDWPRIERSLRRLEQELGFRLTPGNLHRLPGIDPPNPELSRTTAEVRRYRRTGQRPFADVLRDEGIPRLMKDASSWHGLEEQLAARGLYLKKAGRGLHVTDGDEVAKASALDRGSSLAKLEQRFGQSWTEHRARRPQPPPLSQRPASPTPRQDLAAARRQLPRDGSLPQLEEHLSGLLAQDVPDLKTVYRAPEKAAAELRRSLDEAGPIDTYRMLRDRPQHFGELRGRRLLRRADARRAGALRDADRIARDRLDHHLEIQRAREALRHARRYQQRARKLRPPTAPGAEPLEALIRDARQFLQAIPETTRRRLLEMRRPLPKQRTLPHLPSKAPAAASRILGTAARLLTDPVGGVQREALKPLRRALARTATIRGSSALAKHADLILRLLRTAPFIAANPAAASVLLSVQLASRVLQLPARLLERAKRPSQKL